jgi:hypothetical protein
MYLALHYHRNPFLLHSSLSNSLSAYLFSVRLEAPLASQQTDVHGEMTLSNPYPLIEYEWLFQVMIFTSSRVRSNMCGHSLKLRIGAHDMTRLLWLVTRSLRGR